MICVPRTSDRPRFDEQPPLDQVGPETEFEPRVNRDAPQPGRGFESLLDVDLRVDGTDRSTRERNRRPSHSSLAINAVSRPVRVVPERSWERTKRGGDPVERRRQFVDRGRDVRPLEAGGPRDGLEPVLETQFPTAVIRELYARR